MLKRCWDYIVSHKWSKDILRANLLFIALVICYNLFHFHLKPISFHFFNKTFWLMNLCLFIKLCWDAFDRLQKQTK
ncbi:hypothetical protein [Limosilactobacillus sp.]|uniref:hypothetical protein n=1 Tax=Limosilactobacillus sp. TaxID=2773925 RepID=UPI0025C169A9|nr:hypothetical protein [Limosilactobacillus sp.]MCH3921848.1 hypothetical protein [Limosilactobacillus sp.]MCH3928619.1 hypothetical protein [Limosilactobacillus sp.]